MRVFRKVALICTSFFYVISGTLAWGAAGHEITATIAQMYLNPGVLDRICALVMPFEPQPSCHLAPLATWADRIRGLAQYRWASHFHFVTPLADWPPRRCPYGEQGFDGVEGVNVLGGVRNTSQWLMDGKPGGPEAFKFLIHFLGDLHMPLHLTGRDRGGNEDKVRFRNRITNLHSVWDSGLISNSILLTPSNYSHPLPLPWVEAALRGSIYDPFIRTIIWEGIMSQWKDEVHQWPACPVANDAPGIQLPLVDSATTQAPLTAIQSPARWDTSTICPYYWSKPIAELNCQFIWPSVFDFPEDEPPPPPPPHKHPAYVELDTPEYAGRIRKEKVIEKLLAMSGIRIAMILNQLFSD